jgi:hypothetical protein
VQTLKTSEAAALLNVSPNTLRSWERRFGFPRPQRSPGRHRLYTRAEIVSLRNALEDGKPISSAVSLANDAIGADSHAIFSALISFKPRWADDAMEASLALRSLERSIEEVLLPALAHVRSRKGPSSATWAHAAAWANDWLRRAERITAPGPGMPRVLIGDATAGELDAATPYLRALAVCCRRAGGNVLTLPISAVGCLSEATSATDPHVVVIAGGHASDHEVAEWAYAVRSKIDRIPFALFHRGLDPHFAGSRRPVLPSAPTKACRVSFELASRDAARGRVFHDRFPLA